MEVETGETGSNMFKLSGDAITVDPIADKSKVIAMKGNFPK